MRQWWIAFMLMFVLIACGEDDQNDPKSPTATRNVVADFSGPVLNPNTGGTGESCAEPDPNSPNADCEVPLSSSGVDGDSSAPIPLTEQTILGLVLGIPDGFAPIELSNRLVISAIDLTKNPGEFTVIIRRVTPAELEEFLAQIADLNTTQKLDRQNAAGTLTGYSIPYGERGEVAVFELSSGQFLFINGFAAPGSWNTYGATFEAILDSLAVAPE